MLVFPLELLVNVRLESGSLEISKGDIRERLA